MRPFMLRRGYSSGVGTGSYTLDSACKRSTYAYPYLFTQKHTMGSFAFVACSGAKTSDLISKQLPYLTPTTNLVTMTIGGNDIGFASLIEQCTLSDCTATLLSTTANLGTALGPALDTTFSDVRQAAPAARGHRPWLPACLLDLELLRDARYESDGLDLPGPPAALLEPLPRRGEPLARVVHPLLLALDEPPGGE